MKQHNYRRSTSPTTANNTAMSWRDTDSKGTHIFLAFLVALLLFLCAITDSCEARAAGNSTAKNKIPYNVVEALHEGQKWRSSKEGHAQLMSNVYAVYEEYGAWFWKHRGQRPPLVMALTVWIESKGNALGHTGDYSLGEVGLFSVKKSIAKAENINPCHPLLNTWAAQKAYHARRAQMMDLWPWLQEEDEEQQFLMMALTESIGQGATIYFVDQLANKKKPYDKIVALVKKRGNALYEQDKWGHQSANQVAFRVGVARAMYTKVWEAQNKQWCTLPSYEVAAPDVGGWEYPGFKALLKCEKNYTELGDIMPSPQEKQEWLKEMATLNCTPQGF